MSENILFKFQAPKFLYVHYPVCKHTCSYCDFNVYSAQKMSGYNPIWLNAIEAHLARLLEHAKEKSNLQTLYLGGGTPSLLSEIEIEKLLALIEKHYNISSNLEFTIECNPENLTKDYLSGLKKLGVNRLSIGVQTTIPGQLRRLERLATSNKILEGIEDVSSLFKNYSLDLMIGIPDQTLESLETDLEFIRKIRPPHLSIYILTVDDDHKFKTRPAISKRLATNDLISEMYNRCCKVAADIGYQHYEVSNFALPGFESRHNRNYWNVDSEYLAVGPGGHGYLRNSNKINERAQYENILDPKDWSQSENGLGTIEYLDAGQQRLERLYLQLRTRTPIPIVDLNADQIPVLAELGYLDCHKGSVVLTENGWVLLESLAERLLL